MQQTIIKFSRVKLILFVIWACVAVTLGYWMFTLPAGSVVSPRGSLLTSRGLGLVCFVSYSCTGAASIRKLFSDSPGLVLDDIGITIFPMGFIPWCDVSGIRVRRSQYGRIIFVLLKNPEKFLAAYSPVRRAMYKVATVLSASPVRVTSRSLKISFNDLVTVVSEHQRVAARNECSSRRTEK